MGLFSLFRRKKKATSKKSEVYVRVAFAELWQDPKPKAKTYAYRWTLDGSPRVGDRVWVSGLSDKSTAVVVTVTKNPGYDKRYIVNVLRRATPAEIAESKRELEKKRKKALAQHRSELGNSTGASAHELGNLWTRMRADVRGRHYSEWADMVKQLKREKRNGEALALIEECISATLQADGKNPAWWYFDQAFIEYKKAGQSELARGALERYMASAKNPNPKIVERLNKLNSQ